MKRTIKRNLFALTDIFAVIVVLMGVSYYFTKEKNLLVASFIGIGGVAVTGLLQLVSGQSRIENKSGKTVHVKLENGSDAVELLPGEEMYGIDGVRSYNTVYKLGDCVHGVVDENGNIRIKSITGNLINHTNGCALSSPPDEGWDNLFKLPCHEW